MVCINQNEPKLLHLLESLSDQAEEGLEELNKVQYGKVHQFRMTIV